MQPNFMTKTLICKNSHNMDGVNSLNLGTFDKKFSDVT
jgi:hypothetical protein